MYVLKNYLYYGGNIESCLSIQGTFRELALARFNADASRVSRLSYFKLLHEIASSIDAMRPAAKDSGLVVVSVNRGGAAHAARGDKLSRPSEGEREREREREKERIRGARGSIPLKAHSALAEGSPCGSARVRNT